MSDAPSTRRKFLALGGSLLLAACDKSQKKYEFKTRRFGGHLYRQYYRKGFEQYGRIRTYIWNPAEAPSKAGYWSPGPITRDLGDQIQALGIEIDSGIVANSSIGLSSLGVQPDLRRAAITTLRRRVYILDVAGTDRVVSYDAETGTVLAKVNLGQRSPLSMTLSPDHKSLYVLHRQQSAFNPNPALPPMVNVLATDPLRILRKMILPTSISPSLFERCIECTPDGNSLYLVNGGTFANGVYSGSSIVRIDAATGTILNEIAMPVANDGFGTIRISPDGAVLYAAYGRGLFIIDTQTNTISLNVTSVGGRVGSIAIHPNGSTIYVPGGNPFGVLVFDTLSATVSSAIPIPNVRQVKQLTISADGEDLFVNDDLGGKLHHIYLPESRLVESFDNPTDGGVIGMGM